MITSRRRPRPYLEIALILSVLLHLFGAAIYEEVRALGARMHLSQQAREKPSELAAVSDEIHLEKRTVPREAHHRIVPPPQRVVPRRPQSVASQPRVAQLPAPPVLTAPVRNVAPTRPKAEHEDTHIVKHAPPVPLIAKAGTEGAAEKSAGQPQARPPRAFSPAQIASLESQFRRTIAQARTDEANVAKPKRPASTIKNYHAVLAGSLNELMHYRGKYSPLRGWSNGGTDFYYIHLDIVYPDGTVENVDLPWPVSYSALDDPIAREAPLPSVPPPPRGYRLPHPFPLSRAVCDFYRADCLAVIKAEGAAGANAPSVVSP